MTEAQFDAERTKLRERGETSTERTRWEQAEISTLND
jgi:hypothetical protein